MKAAVVYQKGGLPEYTEIDEPRVQADDELLISVKAAAIKHIDKSVAKGSHYSSTSKENARVIGGDGVGTLTDGTRIYALGVNGMIAERAVVRKDSMVKLPHGIDDLTSAALPNAVAGSAMALRYRAAMQGGETVLINGATGFTGKIAVQTAKYYGAGKIIVTGRNQQSLQSLLQLGADEIIFLYQSDEAVVAQLQHIHRTTPIDVVIDYLWGHTAELLLASLKGKGSFTHKTRFVSIGSVTGNTIQLSAQNLRSVDLQLSGSGLGSWTKAQVRELFSDMLPEMFQLAADGKLQIDTIPVKLKDIHHIWNMDVPDGKRLVVVI